MKHFTAVIERDADTGLYVGWVPGFAGAHSQGATLDELQTNLQEVVEMLLEEGDPHLESVFIGTQAVEVAWSMGKVPVLKPREVVVLLERLGFTAVRQRGSHQQFRHVDGRGTTVPFHQGRDISPTLLRQIAKDIGLSVEEVLAGRSSPQPNNALQPSAGELPAPRKPSETSRGWALSFGPIIEDGGKSYRW
jgi:predicted RNA binding protein YcfA (HicA-like mRNA interferase family)/predicted RNase H-like HicB family nuclease